MSLQKDETDLLAKVGSVDFNLKTNLEPGWLPLVRYFVAFMVTIWMAEQCKDNR